MTKNEGSWLIIRTAGLMSGYAAALKLVYLPSGALGLFFAVLGYLSDSSKTAAEYFPFTSWDTGIQAIQCGIYIFLCIYLLRNGRLVHEILNKE